MKRFCPVLVAVALALPVVAQAACIKINPSPGDPTLSGELAKWSASDNTTTTIKLEQGTYDFNVYVDQRGPGQQTCCDASGPNGGLVLKGGYIPGKGCDDNQRSVDASLTTLHGSGANGLFALYFNGPVTISALTFSNYQRNTGSVGVFLFGNLGDSATLKLDHIISIGNEVVFLVGNSVTIRDMLVTGQTDPNTAALSIASTQSSTIATNLTVAGNAGPGLSLDNGYVDNIPAHIYNSIFWANHVGNGGEDIVGYDASVNSVLTVDSSILTNTDIPAADQTNVTNKDPLFKDVGDFHLSTDALAYSPAINAGTTKVTLPGTDIQGAARVQGGAPDMGAYESDGGYAKVFEVDSISDNGSNASPTYGSLRWAILGAQQDAHSKSASANPKYLVSFNLPPASGQLCPAVMSMSGTTAFPDIDFDLTVDGYTQAHTSPNTTYQGFDAVLCVALNGSGAVAHALQTIVNGARTGRLTARGLRLGGFTDAAIKLKGGSGHLIQGNQIGGVGVGSLQLFAENHDGIRITGTAGTSFVGAYDDPATRNLIIDNSNVGVYIDSFTSSSTPGSYVVNNLIGLGSDGVTPAGNGYGVFISGSPRHIIEYNTISGSVTDGLAISGNASQFNSIKNNRIGVDEADPAGGAANGSFAVLLNTGASNNTIGASRTSTYDGNVILSMSDGVYVSTSAGIGNLAMGNSFFVTSALPIDLGAFGSTPNDPPADLDGDTGPNDLQNYPVILHAYRTSAYEWIEGDLDTFANDSLRLDFYLTPGAVGGYMPYLYLGRGSTGLTDASGHAHFWARVSAPDGSTPLSQVSAAATAVNGDTSEIGALVAESGDMIFRDDLEVH